MPKSVAVVAHGDKSFGGGLGAFRDCLRDAGVTDPIWHEVHKSKLAWQCAREVAAAGIDLMYVWGGDGTVQRCVDAVAGTDTVVAIMPAGSANLLASNLGVPVDIEKAVAIGLHGARRRIDLGTMNGEHFAVMAGAGFDARMINSTGKEAKARFGRAAYLWSGMRSIDTDLVEMRIKIDGTEWFAGEASCVLVGNVGSLFGGVEVFERAEPDDGALDVGIVTAQSALQWARAFARVSLGRSDVSPFIRITQGRKIVVDTRRPVRFELDGGARKKVKKLKIEVVPNAINIAVPHEVAA